MNSTLVPTMTRNTVAIAVCGRIAHFPASEMAKDRRRPTVSTVLPETTTATIVTHAGDGPLRPKRGMLRLKNCARSAVAYGAPTHVDSKPDQNSLARPFPVLVLGDNRLSEALEVFDFGQPLRFVS
jgi:hypothetical protein